MELRLELPPTPDVELVAIRAADLLAERLGFDASGRDAIGIALAEACLNAIEHGRNGEGIMVKLAVEEAAGGRALVVEVEDHGPGFDPQTSGRRPASGGTVMKRGWGLVLMRELMDEVEIVSHSGGTVVRMRKVLEDGR